jgi:hypothetical protein
MVRLPVGTTTAYKLEILFRDLQDAVLYRRDMLLLLFTHDYIDPFFFYVPENLPVA